MMTNNDVIMTNRGSSGFVLSSFPDLTTPVTCLTLVLFLAHEVTLVVSPDGEFLAVAFTFGRNANLIRVKDGKLLRVFTRLER